jgi:hypothetical protein
METKIATGKKYKLKDEILNLPYTGLSIYDLDPIYSRPEMGEVLGRKIQAMLDGPEDRYIGTYDICRTNHSTVRDKLDCPHCL